MDIVLELRDLAKHYLTQKAVDGISLAVGKAEFFSLVGPSGCGKTTTLRLIAGFEEPTSGDIFLNRKSVASLKPYDRNVSTVFQNYALFPHLTVLQNVMFGLKRQSARSNGIRRDTQALQKTAEEALASVQLSGKESRMPNQISGGERQRVALARSLVLQPDVLLLDEPLSALDPSLRKQMRNELKNLQRQVGITFLFITHDQEEALSLSDRMGIMNAGVLEQVGTPQELYHQPNSRFVAEFLGGVNWVQGRAVRPEAVQIQRETPGNGFPALSCNRPTIHFLGKLLPRHNSAARRNRMCSRSARSRLQLHLRRSCARVLASC